MMNFLFGSGLSLFSLSLLTGFALWGCSDDSSSPSGDGDGDAGSGGDGGGGPGGGGSTGSKGLCGAKISDDAPALSGLKWDYLPLLYSGLEKTAGESLVRVGPSGDIYVGATTAKGNSWMSPYEFIVQRFDGEQWEIVGGAPVASAEEGYTGNGGLAVDCAGNVFAATSAAQRQVFQLEGDSWVEIELPVVPFSRALGTDAEGYFLIAGLSADERIEVHRFVDGEWEQLGDGFEAKPPLSFSGNFATAPDQVALASDSSVHLFDGSAWMDLGAVGPDEASFVTTALTSGGELFASYRTDSDAGTLLFASKYDVGSAKFESLEGNLQFEGPGASYSVLGVDPWDRLLATWREGEVYVGLYEEGSGWTPFVVDGVVSAATDGGTLPSLAFGLNGLPVVSWESITPENGGVIGVARAVKN